MLLKSDKYKCTDYRGVLISGVRVAGGVTGHLRGGVVLLRPGDSVLTGSPGSPGSQIFERALAHKQIIMGVATIN